MKHVFSMTIKRVSIFGKGQSSCSLVMYLFTLFKSKSYATVTIVVKSALLVLSAFPYQEEV